MKSTRLSIKYFLRLLISLAIIIIATVIIILFPVISSDANEKSSEERIDAFPESNLPLKENATIFWNENMIPFIDAKTDEDAAFLLGLVNAHLRLGQMEILRMLAQGRLSEMIGPFGTRIDHGLRILDIDKAVDDIVMNQDEHTRLWVQSYVNGINFYLDQMQEVPKEYKLLNIPITRWKSRDVYSLARLASADLTWGVYIQTLLYSKNKGWEKIWDFFLEKGQTSIPSFSSNDGETIYQLFNHISKSGSNSLVVSAKKSFNGNALMANDPHLGIFAPNMWFLVGYKSPSYHCIGMQIPGIPFLALGRNTDIAWGGTNMRSISSHLIEITEDQLTNAKSHSEKINVRFWFDKNIEIRETAIGPVISDAPFLDHVDKPLALQWLGHLKTNELKSFLLANKARNFEEFRLAFKGYAVSGQNLIYADNQGNIGQISAYTQPLLKDTDKTLELVKSADNYIVGGIDSYDLPYSFNPPKGFIASANNLPFPTEIPIAFEYSGYNRMLRMSEVCESTDSITFEMLVSLQTDVMSYQALDLKELILDQVDGNNAQLEEIDPAYWESFKQWDGNYDAASQGAVAFETMMYFFSSTLIKKYYPEEYMVGFFMNDDRWLVLLPKLIGQESTDDIVEYLKEAMKNGKKYFKRYESWGDMHRLVFGSILAPIPVIGSKYILADIGVGGTSNTLMKTAHAFSHEKHTISYGSNSRHISNMEDIDENYFALLGGQDGWIKSPHNYDQLLLWQKKEYIRFPLRIQSIQQEFNYHVSTLTTSHWSLATSH